METNGYKPFTRSEKRYPPVTGFFRPSGEPTEGELVYNRAMEALDEAVDLWCLLTLNQIRDSVWA